MFSVESSPGEDVWCRIGCEIIAVLLTMNPSDSPENGRGKNRLAGSMAIANGKPWSV